MLKGFASRTTIKSVFVWLYRKNCPVLETNIKNVGVGRDFYGRPGKTSLDAAITAQESGYAQLIEALRNQESGPVHDGEEIPGLLTHLTTRTKAIGQSVENSMTYFLKLLKARVTDKNAFRAILAGPSGQAMIRDDLTKTGATIEQARAIASNPGFIASMLEGINEQPMGLYWELLESKYGSLIHEAHIRVLKENQDMYQRTDMFKKFHWYTFRSERPLILGDTVCIFETDSRRRFEPLNGAEHLIHRVWLPLSADRILAGTPFRSRPSFDPRRVNKAAARCSSEFFISSILLRESALPASIGKWSDVLSEDELIALANGIGMDDA